jgi:ABC-type sugar transport system ATPase subunit
MVSTPTTFPSGSSCAGTEIAQRVHAAAEKLGLTTTLDRRPATLSGGQRQRVALGPALVRNPKAFLLDEPLSNLDAKLRL